MGGGAMGGGAVRGGPAAATLHATFVSSRVRLGQCWGCSWREPGGGLASAEVVARWRPRLPNCAHTLRTKVVHERLTSLRRTLARVEKAPVHRSGRGSGGKMWPGFPTALAPLLLSDNVVAQMFQSSESRVSFKCSQAVQSKHV